MLSHVREAIDKAMSDGCIHDYHASPACPHVSGLAMTTSRQGVAYLECSPLPFSRAAGANLLVLCVIYDDGFVLPYHSLLSWIPPKDGTSASDTDVHIYH